MQPLQETAALELDQRALTGRRPALTEAECLTALTMGGATALGWEAGAIRPGRLADFVALTSDRPFDPVTEGLLFAPVQLTVDTVIVAGRPIVLGGQHLGHPDGLRRGAEIQRQLAGRDASSS